MRGQFARVRRHAVARRVLVVGAAGRFAGLVPQALRDSGVTVRGLVRDAGRSAVALANGADEVAVGDLRSPQALAAALDGIDGVFYIVRELAGSTARAA
ncbi:NmrA family NAD(P)-binding protein [Cupriavidus gilardii]|uniref:NmrA family NAD(P)-binding protein n=1 Tax=Cupriavidus gilardii TaxID=82541 RepID=UPI001FCFFFC4|nr:NmrA family NAD(P)-binding protein [Cupriavidus gilardii]MCT9070005.1 NmrA family NAD(P)-binding protein [Cupriavidus gilardii]